MFIKSFLHYQSSSLNVTPLTQGSCYFLSLTFFFFYNDGKIWRLSFWQMNTECDLPLPNVIHMQRCQQHTWTTYSRPPVLLVSSLRMNSLLSSGLVLDLICMTLFSSWFKRHIGWLFSYITLAITKCHVTLINGYACQHSAIM